VRAAPAALLAVAAMATAGCQSQWVAGARREDIARTDVVVRTTPPGAVIFFNDKKMSAPSPIRIPVEYTHAQTQYLRQNNYGSRMRENMSTVVEIVTFPVWAVASLFHFEEQKLRHEYGGNVHNITTYLPGYEDGETTVTLEGEADHPVDFQLVKLAK
jgi:hypothetical protein